jgi:hypothetical protein
VPSTGCWASLKVPCASSTVRTQWPADSHVTGVKSYDVSLDTQTATVQAEPSLDYETVLKTIKKTGKKVNSGEADGVSKSVELTA